MNRASDGEHPRPVGQPKRPTDERATPETAAPRAAPPDVAAAQAANDGSHAISKPEARSDSEKATELSDTPDAEGATTAKNAGQKLSRAAKGSSVSGSRTIAYQFDASSGRAAKGQGAADAGLKSTHSAHPSDSAAISDDANTVISQRPVAAPEEFYRSMPLAELAGMLEGRQLDHFAVDQMIGGGGMGAVFRGRDLRLDRVVAIKVIPAAKHDAELLRRFRLEAQAAARLDHPNIARVFYVGEAEQWSYIVFEFIDGVNIRDLVDLDGPLAIDEAVYYVRQVAEALEHAHQREVVHRDIKPSNILVTSMGHIKVVDMGLARDTSMNKANADATASGITLGTFDYISPEQARNPRDADVRSDLYSLGCSLFYMLTGNPPFPEGTALQKLLNHGSQPPPDPRAWRDDVSDQLYEIMLKMMAKKPGDRYQQPLDLINDLVLLAELEELPRSQLPGTYVVNPTATQRSLLDMNLSWMVALAFLLGSTLWLQSVQSMSGDVPNPAPRFDASFQDANATELTGGLPAPIGSVAESRATGASEPTTDDPPAYRLPGAVPASELPDLSAAESRNSAPASGDLLVVSAQLPYDVAPMNWESSLATAFARVKPGSGYRDIEVRGTVVVDRPVTIGSPVVLRGPAGTAAVVEFSTAALAATEDWGGMLSLGQTSLRCSGIAFRVEVPTDMPVGRIGIFDLGPGGTLELERCSVTIVDSLRTGSLNAVVGRGAVRSVVGKPEADAPSLQQSGSPISEVIGQSVSDGREQIPPATVLLSDCLMRGEATFLNFQTVNLPGRLEAKLERCLFALSGPMFEIAAANTTDSVHRFVRVVCQESTFLNEQGFAVIEYTGEGAPMLGLERTSSSCVYWSPAGTSHVTIRGARRQTTLGNFNYVLFFRGGQNAYDRNIEDICHSFASGAPIPFGFAEAQDNGWFDERANDLEVPWVQLEIPQYPLHQFQYEDAAISSSGVFQPGVKVAELPPL